MPLALPAGEFARWHDGMVRATAEGRQGVRERGQCGFHRALCRDDPVSGRRDHDRLLVPRDEARASRAADGVRDGDVRRAEVTLDEAALILLRGVSGANALEIARGAGVSSTTVERYLNGISTPPARNARPDLHLHLATAQRASAA